MTNNVLEIEDLVLNRKKLSLPPISFFLEKQTGLGIYGTNGSGKSTLLDTIAGVLPKKSGSVIINGKVGYAMQPEGFQENMTCLDNLYLEAAYAGLSKQVAKSRIETYSLECDLQDFLMKKVTDLSSGMKVRLMLAASFLIEPDLLLLDESFNALDEESIQKIKQILLKKKANGMSLIFVSHNKMHFDELCDSLLLFPSLEVIAL